MKVVQGPWDFMEGLECGRVQGRSPGAGWTFSSLLFSSTLQLWNETKQPTNQNLLVFFFICLFVCFFLPKDRITVGNILGSVPVTV